MAAARPVTLGRVNRANSAPSFGTIGLPRVTLPGFLLDSWPMGDLVQPLAAGSAYAIEHRDRRMRRGVSGDPWSSWMAYQALCRKTWPRRRLPSPRHIS